MNLPLLSIITVTYNAEATVERTLKSVECQTYRGFIEHIIVDGASNDGTVDIVKAYKNRNAAINVTIISERDDGLYYAMNKGLRVAKGEFVCFLNAGDKFHDARTVEDVFDNIDNIDDVGIIYGDTDVVDIDGHFLRHRHLSAPVSLTWKSFQRGMLVCHQSFYARRGICVPYDTKYHYSADVDWCIKVMKESDKRHLKNINTQMILTDYLDGGMTRKNHVASLIERFKVMACHYGLLTTVWNHFTFIFR